MLLNNALSAAGVPNKSGNDYGFRDAAESVGVIATAKEEPRSQRHRKKKEDGIPIKKIVSRGKTDSTSWLSTNGIRGTVIYLQDRVHWDNMCTNNASCTTKGNCPRNAPHNSTVLDSTGTCRNRGNISYGRRDSTSWLPTTRRTATAAYLKNRVHWRNG